MNIDEEKYNLDRIRKVILFIVEGQSEKIILDLIGDIFNDNRIVFHVVNGDISSDNNVTVDNAENKIKMMIESEIRQYRLKKSDILKVVHIFDMDGAYIPDEMIKISNDEDFYYKDDGIYCKYINRVKSRNSHKREIMNYLTSLDKIAGKYTYECYYFACNLDHAIYGENNLDNSVKVPKANIFIESILNIANYMKCDVNKGEVFVDYLALNVANGVPNTYEKSWNYIKEKDNSLQRHTNFHLFFNKMNIILHYKNFFTIINYSEEDNVYYGKIEGIDSLVNFESKFLSQVDNAFHKAVDDYISHCDEIDSHED